MAIDKAIVERIWDTTNIVDVVSDFVSLQRRGANHWGLCPFHNDRSPSFAVSPSKGIFKCFSCGKSGNAVSFLMDLEGMSYVEALKWLGKKYGIDVKERELTSKEKEAEAARESLYAANDFALKYFESVMSDTEDGQNIGLSYFRERGINDAMIKKFHLGYSLDVAADLYEKAVEAGYEEKYLIETGLCIKGESGRIHDRFRGRVIYPVLSLSGRVVAFGARTLRKEKTVPKYLNSPESAIYSKSRELYGMYQARSAIARKKNCILVEGYMDVISMHQVGVENVVASSGTALTDGQVAIIKRFANSVTLIYDADFAGIKAALRGINMFVAAGLALSLVLLPEGEDPDSFAQSHSLEEVERYIEEHSQNLIDFKVDILMKDSGNDPRKRTEAINNILETLSLIPDPVEQSLYIDKCAGTVGVSADILSRQIKVLIARRQEKAYNQRQREISEATIESIEKANIVAEQSNAADANTDAQSTATQATPDKPAISKARYQAEEELITYVLRYGMLYICDVFPNNEAEKAVPMGVLDFIKCELGNDGITFINPLFEKVWELAVRISREQWPARQAEHDALLLHKREEACEAGREEIRRRDLPMNEVVKLENQLVERTNAEYTAATDEYASSFICEMLMRSDDRSVSDIAVKLTTDKVVLSKMHPKVDVRKEVCEKLPVAVNTLRGVIIKEQLQDLLCQLNTIPSTDKEALTDTLSRIKELKDLSMEFDKVNGERVITPGHNV